VNTFAYVRGRPLSSIDRFGLDDTFWGGPGRSFPFDGPANGNWGGKNWSGGQAPSANGGRAGNKPPTDSADRCYMGHDKCFTTCAIIYGRDASNLFCKNIVCNRQLSKCLNDLGNNCSKWPDPPRPGTEQETMGFLRDALSWFEPNAMGVNTPGVRNEPPEFSPYIGNENVPPSDFLDRNWK